MIVVEGYIDALAMHQAGIVNTVASMGTSITENQIARLKQFAPTAVLMLDGDDAGAGAVTRAGVLARQLGLEVLVATLPAHTDPADLLQREGGHAHDPAAELPDDDELVALITSLLTAPLAGAK